ncbi:nucleotide-binding alpha-beta plait domain-containing protein [Tanacetum coccineum]
MGTFRSKEDDVAKISISVFVTNFPDSISSKDLFNACKQYGHVVDSFIATKRSKAGKRFGFVRIYLPVNVETVNIVTDRRFRLALKFEQVKFFLVCEEAQASNDNPSPVPNAINKRSKTGGSHFGLFGSELNKVVIQWAIH